MLHLSYILDLKSSSHPLYKTAVGYLQAYAHYSSIVRSNARNVGQNMSRHPSLEISLPCLVTEARMKQDYGQNCEAINLLTTVQ